MIIERSGWYMKRFFVLFLLALTVSISAHDWKDQASGTTQDLQSVSVVTNNIAWICGNGGTVLLTTDEGVTWQSKGGGSVIGTTNLMNIFGIDAQSALVSASPETDPVTHATTAYVYRTTNAGQSWTKVYTLAGGMINGIFMFDSNRGVLVANPIGGRWSVWATTNGGATWDSTGIRLPAGSTTEAGFNNSIYGDAASKTVWFGTNNSRMYVSTDYGMTWTAKPTAGLTDIHSIYFSGSNGLAAGTGLYITANGGSTWKAINTMGSGPITGILVHDNWDSWMTRLGTANAPDNHIYTAQNFGDSTWKVEYTAPDSKAYLHMTTARNDEGNVWAVRQGGGITVGLHAHGETDVKQISGKAPDNYYLSQNYPNPFNPSTKINYSVAKEGLVTLKVFNVLGQLVTTLVNEVQRTGQYEVSFSAANLTSGIYYYSLEAQGFRQVNKMIYMK